MITTHARPVRLSVRLSGSPSACLGVPDRRTDRRTNIMAIVRRFVLTNASRDNKRTFTASCICVAIFRVNVDDMKLGSHSLLFEVSFRYRFYNKNLQSLVHSSKLLTYLKTSTVKKIGDSISSTRTARSCIKSVMVTDDDRRNFSNFSDRRQRITSA